jgi:hypothetical protein
MKAPTAPAKGPAKRAMTFAEASAAVAGDNGDDDGSVEQE